MELNGSTVVVTGSGGFLGRYVAEALKARGVTVVGVAQRDYDLRRRSDIERLLAKARPDAVVHLAAVVGGIGANRAEPGRFFYDNALMGIEMIDVCRVAEVAKILVAGTVCAYPKHAPVPFKEDGIWDGYPEETNAPYGLAKKMLLVQAQAYREQYGTNAIYLLPVNLYGPRDNFDLETGHVIPAMIRRFLDARDAASSEVVLWGDGSATREFLYVADAAQAFCLALERYDGAAPVNLGSGREIAIRDLADIIAKATDYHGAVVWDTTKPNGQPRRRLDTTRAGELFGFQASTSFEQGIADTVKWFESERGAAVHPGIS